MSAATDAERLARRSQTGGAQPILPLEFPKLPLKLRQIDPVGTEQWWNDMNQAFARWIEKQNTANQNLASQIKP